MYTVTTARLSIDDILVDQPFDVSYVADPGYLLTIEKAIKWTKKHMNNSSKDESGTILEINEALPVSDISGTLQVNKVKYGFSKGELTVWLTLSYSGEYDTLLWKLDGELKIIVKSSGYEAFCSFWQYETNNNTDFVDGDYWYWSINHDKSTKETSIFKTTKAVNVNSGSLETSLTTRSSNSDGKYDFLYDFLRDGAGSYSHYALNRSNGLFVSAYPPPGSIHLISIFNTDFSFIGKTDSTIDAVPISFEGNSIDTSNYVTFWPSDYTSLKSDYRTKLIDLETSVIAEIEAGTYFPSAEFAGL